MRQRLSPRTQLAAAVAAAAALSASSLVVPGAHAAGSPTGILELDDYVVSYELSAEPRAYEPLTVDYEITPKDGHTGSSFVAVQGNFQEESGGAEFTTAIPNDVAARFHYLGSTPIFAPDDIAGDNSAEAILAHEAPRAAFRYHFVEVTNTGDTAWPAQGVGQISVGLDVLNSDGASVAPAIEQLQMLQKDVMPGETVSLTLPDYATLNPGEYTLQFNLSLLRHAFNPYSFPIYQVPPISYMQWEFDVTDSNELPAPSARIPVTEPQPATMNVGVPRKPAAGLESVAEFLTAYDTYPSASDGVSGSLAVQLPPWDGYLTLRAVGEQDGDVDLVRIPLDVDLSAVKVAARGQSALTESWVGVDGAPFVSTWYYAPRTINFAADPFAKITADLTDMKSRGVTAFWLQMFSVWALNDNINGRVIDFTMQKARDLGLKVIPSLDFQRLSSLVDQTDVAVEINPAKGNLSIADPALPSAFAAWYNRLEEEWGDVFYTTSDGKTVVNLSEDQLGAWHNNGIRDVFGTARELDSWHAWLGAKYTSVEGLNSSWGTTYESVSDVPLPGAEPSAPFTEWTPALEDYDTWRSHVIVSMYDEAAELIKSEHPDSLVGLLAGESNVHAQSAPNTDNPYGSIGLNWVERRTGMLGSEIFATDDLDFIAANGTFTFDLDAEGQLYLENELVPLLYPMVQRINFDPRQVAGVPPQSTRYAGLDTPGFGSWNLEPLFPALKDQWESFGLATFYAWNDHPLLTTVTDVQRRELDIFREAAAATETDYAPVLALPAEAAAGDTIEFTGTGFAPGESVSVRIGEEDAVVVTSDENGAIRGELKVAENASAGDYSVTAIGAVSKTEARASIRVMTDASEPADTSVSLASASDDPVTGKNITLVASVNPAGAAGKIDFLEGDAVVGSATVVEGAASADVLAATAGKRTFVARFVSSDSKLFVGSESAPLTLDVRDPSVPAAELALEKKSVPQGGSLEVTGRGFSAGETVSNTLHSTPIRLDEVVADAAGSFRIVITVPRSASIGTHTLVASGADSSLTAKAALQVTEAGTGAGLLAQTGGAVPLSLLARAMLLLAAGVILVVRRRRRQA